MGELTRYLTQREGRQTQVRMQVPENVLKPARLSFFYEFKLKRVDLPLSAKSCGLSPGSLGGFRGPSIARSHQ